MDIGRFHHAIYLLHNEYIQQGISSKFQELINALNQISGNPGNQDLIVNFRNTLNNLQQSLNDLSLNKSHQSLKGIYDEISASNYFGTKLSNEIKKTIEENQLTSNLAAQALQNLFGKVEKFYANISKIDSAFSELDIRYEEIDFGECEIEILLPIEPLSKTLKDLSKETNKWHNALSAFSEIFDPENEPIKVRTISNGSWLFYLASTATVLLGISYCLKNLNKILVELVETKKLVQQLTSKNNIPEETIKQLASDLEGQLDTKIKALASETVQNNYKGDQGRSNELETHLTQGLKFLAVQISNGSKIDLRISPPEEIEKTEDSEPNQQLIDENNELKRIALEVEKNMSQIDFDSENNKLPELLSAPEQTEKEN